MCGSRVGRGMDLAKRRAAAKQPSSQRGRTGCRVHATFTGFRLLVPIPVRRRRTDHNASNPRPRRRTHTPSWSSEEQEQLSGLPRLGVRRASPIGLFACRCSSPVAAPRQPRRDTPTAPGPPMFRACRASAKRVAFGPQPPRAISPSSGTAALHGPRRRGRAFSSTAPAALSATGTGGGPTPHVVAKTAAEAEAVRAGVEKLLRPASSGAGPSSTGRWSLTSDAQGVERAFRFKTFTKTWVRWDGGRPRAPGRHGSRGRGRGRREAGGVVCARARRRD